MTITAQQFVDIWLKKWWTEDDLWSYCKSAYTLLKKYGAKLWTDSVRKVIEKYDISLLGFLDLLHSLEKANCDDVEYIQSLLDIEEESQWTIHTSHPDKVSNIKKWAYIEEQEAVWLTVKGDGKVYKRSLNRDVDKLLES